jgi:alanyl-tRNA synthetase
MTPRLSPDEIRERYLAFFEKHGHVRVASASLVPENDPSLLFTGAGMNQFKDEFLGKGRRGLKRAASSQKCLRTGDLDNVGRTAGHMSFFEMLGNFSFGDYFKKEAIAWQWEFLTKELGIPADKLSISVYQDDDEAFAIWEKDIKIPTARIYRLGAKSNFWPANAPADGPNGPCGPCSEMFFDYGEDKRLFPCNVEGCGPACDCGRFIEVGNIVFTQFDRQDGGKLVPLAQKNIDTGMGFERLTAVHEGVYKVLESSIFTAILDAIARAAGKPGYAKDGEDGVRTRRIADHVRAACFLASDGVRPSNEGRGYVMRRIVRRSIRDGHMLGIERPFLADLVPQIGLSMGSAYPELRDGADGIAGVLAAEEAQFRRTFANGMNRLDEVLARLKPEIESFERALPGRVAAAVAAAGENTYAVREPMYMFPGDIVFQLHDTYGFPVDITEEILRERGLLFDRKRFDACMAEQQERSRGAAKMTTDIFDRGPLGKLAESGVATTAFLGYGDPNGATREARRGTVGAGKLVGVVLREELHREIRPGEDAALVLDRTPFYAESGGQIGDAGEIAFASGVFKVTDCKAKSGYWLHVGRYEGTAPAKVGDAAECRVDAVRRDAVRRNHTGTHLLHKALKVVLGDKVNQQGSLVAPDRLRFDFTFDRALTADEIRRIEDEVNAEILRNEPLVTQVLPVEEAKRSGAVALFGEKYPDPVRVVAVGDFSKELCGGTHCRAAGDIGSLRITSEGSIASGIRRLEAVTGAGAVRQMQEDRDTLTGLSRKLGVPVGEIEARFAKLQDEIKQLKKRPAAAPTTGFDAATGDAVEAGGVKCFVHLVEKSREEITAAAEAVAKRPGDPVVALLVTTADGKLTAIVAGSPAAVERGFDAGAFLKAAGGKGGGKKHLAQGTFPGGAPTLESLRSGASAALAGFTK